MGTSRLLLTAVLAVAFGWLAWNVLRSEWDQRAGIVATALAAAGLSALMAGLLRKHGPVWAACPTLP